MVSFQKSYILHYKQPTNSLGCPQLLTAGACVILKQTITCSKFSILFSVLQGVQVQSELTEKKKHKVGLLITISTSLFYSRRMPRLHLGLVCVHVFHQLLQLCWGNLPPQKNESLSCSFQRLSVAI